MFPPARVRRQLGNQGGEILLGVGSKDVKLMSQTVRGTSRQELLHSSLWVPNRTWGLAEILWVDLGGEDAFRF